MVPLQQRIAEMKRDGGATFIEYGLLITLIAVVLIVAVIFFSDGLEMVFGDAGSSMSQAAG